MAKKAKRDPAQSEAPEVLTADVLVIVFNGKLNPAKEPFGVYLRNTNYVPFVGCGNNSAVNIDLTTNTVKAMASGRELKKSPNLTPSEYNISICKTGSSYLVNLYLDSPILTTKSHRNVQPEELLGLVRPMLEAHVAWFNARYPTRQYA